MSEKNLRLRFAEPLCGSISLFTASCIWLGVRVENITVFNLDIDDTSDQDGLVSFHNRIEQHREILLVCAALLWLTLPMVIVHIYCMKRVFETLFTFANLQAWKWLYMFTWIVNCSIWCCLMSCVIVVVAYYGMYSSYISIPIFFFFFIFRD